MLCEGVGSQFLGSLWLLRTNDSVKSNKLREVMLLSFLVIHYHSTKVKAQFREIQNQHK